MQIIHIIGIGGYVLNDALDKDGHAMTQRELVDSTDCLGDPERLRARAQQDGYLFFRGLLPAADVLQMRAELLEVVTRHGLRDARRDALDGTVDAASLNRVSAEDLRDDIGVPKTLYEDVQKLPSMHRLPHHPRLLGFYRSFFGQEVLVHPRHIVRMVTSHPAMTPTPAHQDFPHIQGTPNTWTCWFPVGDCPQELGGLTVLNASHRQGTLPVQPALGAGGAAVELCPNETDWVTTDYGVGDVLTFPSHTVHKALRCTLDDQIRLSFDVRYQSADEPVEVRSLQPHCELSWEEIYQDWGDDDAALQYYWAQEKQEISAWDDTLHQPGRRIC